MAERVTAEAIRKQREIRVPVESGRYTFVLEVPSDRAFFAVMEAHPASADAILNCELVKACMVGWDGVKASDLLSSGTDDAATFEKRAASEWLDDHAEWWAELAAALLDARAQRKAQREADRGNS